MKDFDEIIARDDMFIVTNPRPLPGRAREQFKQLVDYTNSEIPFDDWLREYLDFIDEWLASLGRYRASGALWIADGTVSNLDEVPPDRRVAGRAIWGCDYLLEKEKPLTLPWWLARLAQEARFTLGAVDQDHKLHRALALGELRQKLKSHRLYLHLITSARKAKHGHSLGGRSRLKTKPAPVLARANELRAANANLSDRSIAGIIHREQNVPLGTVRRIIAGQNKLAHR